MVLRRIVYKCIIASRASQKSRLRQDIERTLTFFRVDVENIDEMF
jgi:hypothetical protein